MLETLTEAVNSMRRELSERMDKLEGKVEDVRLQVMSVEVRLERVEASVSEALSVAYNALSITQHTRADVKVLREEIHAWA